MDNFEKNSLNHNLNMVKCPNKKTHHMIFRNFVEATIKNKILDNFDYCKGSSDVR